MSSGLLQADPCCSTRGWRTRPRRRACTVTAAGVAEAKRPSQGELFAGQPERGAPTPQGASLTPRGVNFAVCADEATAVSLVLYTPAGLAAGTPALELELAPERHRTGGTWHVALAGLAAGVLYGWRVRGPSAPRPGQLFAPGAVLLDPYAAEVVSRPEFGLPGLDGGCWPQLAAAPPAAGAPFDWQGAVSPRRPLEDLVIYEAHVRGMTAHPSAGTAAAGGTYAALAEKVPYLVSLGVTALELLPIAEFNELELGGGGRVNFWGYSTLAFGAPMARFAAAPPAGPGAAAELKALVRACHAAGIEVLLDVVVNHSCEGSEAGPTLSLRGLDNEGYYLTAPAGQAYNYSGCGNTLHCNHPRARDLVLASLRRWVLEFHIDGFRFDLAAILTRAAATREPGAAHGAGEGGPARGDPLEDPPLVAAIAADPVLAGCKLLAEAWDAGGLYQVGAFPHQGGAWAEWNGRFRDAARAFIKGTDGAAGDFAERLCGSPGLYAAGGRRPGHSVNFVTAHDGFSLADLVAYNRKRNEANGEEGRDGEEHNLSWNCGGGDADDGPSSSAGVLALRRRQQRNLLAALFLAQGTPMVVMGDEYGHSKGGNNNTYCHDSALNYFDWAAAAEDAEGLRRFTAALAAFRAATPALRLRAHPTGEQVAWHGLQPDTPDWSPTSRLVAFTLRCATPGAPPLYIAFNAGHTPVTLALPPPGDGRAWRLVMDTALPPPFDLPAADVPEPLRVAAAAQHASLGALLYVLLDRAVLVLQAVGEGD